MQTTTTTTTEWTEQDEAILSGVDAAIVQGRDLLNWWDRQKGSPANFPNRFPVGLQTHDPDFNFGFIQDANLRRGVLPVAGVTQDQLYDFPKVPPGSMGNSPEWTASQIQEYILQYFMRLSYAQSDALTPQTPVKQPPGPLERFSLCGTKAPTKTGWGYEQWYYKLDSTGEVGKFPDSQRYQTVDLREIGTKYSWVVFKVTIYHFDFVIPLGSNGPSLVIPVPQPVYAVMTPDFVINRPNPAPGVIGEYGYGYSVVPDPTYKTLFAAGPSEITNTIETLHFRVLDTGEVRAHMDFITPQPPAILNLKPVEWSFDIADRLTAGMASKVLGPLKKAMEGLEPQLDPVYMTVRLLNLATLGLASDEFCINREQLFKMLMILHFTDVFHMYNMSASHFRMVPDWKDTANLPTWATEGTYNLSLQ